MKALTEKAQLYMSHMRHCVPASARRGSGGAAIQECGNMHRHVACCPCDNTLSGP